MSTLRTLLVDDHTLVRAGIKALIKTMDDIEVIDEAGDGQTAIELVKAHVPDLVLIDVGLPGLNGIDVTTRVKKEFPNVAVLVLSMYSNERYVLQALKAGASGYLVKEAATGELEIAIRAVVSGKVYLSPGVSKRFINDILDGGAKFENPLERLTQRHKEILQLIAEGNSTKAIAKVLNVSTKTVEAHRAQVMQRLDIHDIPGLVRYAMRMGLIAPEM